MKLGVVFPQTEIGTDPEVVARFATTAEAAGYDHIIAFDHVLGANTASRPDWQGPYTSESLFHEPFVLYGYLAGLTESLELVTAVIILPQRQTALVAKQAASLDVLSGGRLRLGIGTGWNDVEYEALGENFHDRGVRSEEQIDLMRKLWADDTIDYDGRWHRVTDAGLNPLPVRRSIPLWLGGMAPQVIERVGRHRGRLVPVLQPGPRGAARHDAGRGARRRPRPGRHRRGMHAAHGRGWAEGTRPHPFSRGPRRHPHGRHHHEPGPGPGRPRGRHLPLLGSGRVPRVLRVN